MMTILHRLRGTWSWMAKVVGVLLGLLFGLITDNPYLGLAVAIGYIAGESWGWGDWIGGLIDGRDFIGAEGRNNGIAWLAEKIVAFNYPSQGRSLADTVRRYNIAALIIRGVYWWVPTLGPLAWALNPIEVTVGIVFLSLFWPVSIWLAQETKFIIPGLVSDTWSRSEIIYGVAQDLVFTLLIAHYLLGV